LAEGEGPTLVVNAGREAVTTAIVKDGVVLLHRTVDLGEGVGGEGPAQEEAGEFAAITAAMQRGAAASSEVAQAVSVAAAYFEDTLERGPEAVLTAGPLGAPALAGLLGQAEVGPVTVREMVDRGMLDVGVASGSAGGAGSHGGVPLGWLAGVRGALKN
jgi:type IV pilus assembly protein PilM